MRREDIQRRRLFRVMSDRGWYTLEHLAARLDIPTPSVSARLRDFRKMEYGAHKVEVKRFVLAGSERSICHYRLNPTPGSSRPIRRELCPWWAMPIDTQKLAQEIVVDAFPHLRELALTIARGGHHG